MGGVGSAGGKGASEFKNPPRMAESIPFHQFYAAKLEFVPVPALTGSARDVPSECTDPSRQEFLRALLSQLPARESLPPASRWRALSAELPDRPPLRQTQAAGTRSQCRFFRARRAARDTPSAQGIP